MTVRRYYVTNIIGIGKRRLGDPFRSPLADLGNDWGMIDLRPDATKSDGYCIAYIDRDEPLPELPDGSFIHEIDTKGNKLAITSKEISTLNKILGKKAKGSTLPAYIASITINENTTPMSDGKHRIAIGNILYGPPMRKYKKPGTVTDDFNRSDSDDLGTSSEGWDWNPCEDYGDVDIASNKAVFVGSGCWVVAEAVAPEPVTINHWSEAEIWLSGTNAQGYVDVRCTIPDGTHINAYECGTNGYGSCWDIWKIIDSFDTQLATEVVGWATPNGAVIRGEVDGTVISVYQDDVLKLQVTDASIFPSLNYIHGGISGYQDSGDVVSFDNFRAGDLEAGADYAQVATFGWGDTETGDSLVLTMPPDIAAGDLLLALVSHDTSANITQSGGSDWTRIYTRANGTAVQMAIFAKIASGGDSLTLTDNGDNQDMCCTVLRIINHGVTDVSTDIILATAATGTNAAPDPPNCNPGVSKKWQWIEFAAADDDDGTTPFWSTGYSNLEWYESAQTTSSCMLIAAFRWNEATSENPDAMALADVEEWVAQTIGIPPYGTSPASLSGGAGTVLAGAARLLL